MNREEYLRDVVTSSFVRRITLDVVHRVIGTDDFLNLGDFSEFLTLQFLADPEAEIETMIFVRIPDDQIVFEDDGRIAAAFPITINVGFRRGTFSVTVPLTGFLELEGSLKDLEWHAAEARIQLPTHKTFDFSVHDRLFQMDVWEVLEDNEENAMKLPKKKR